MKRILSISLFIGLLLPTSLLPYYAEKKGLKVMVVDYARTPEALCVEPEVSDMVAGSIGKGISAKRFIDFGLRPLGVSITNTTDKPMMLSPAYGKKAGLMDFINPAYSMLPAYYVPCIFGAELAFGASITSLILGAAAWDNEGKAIGYTISGITFAAFLASLYILIKDGYAFNQFYGAAQKKFDELNFKDETLILPGQTVHKLLLCTKDEYISRFPLVIYPLEKREDMIVFDVDLRA